MFENAQRLTDYVLFKLLFMKVQKKPESAEVVKVLCFGEF